MLFNIKIRGILLKKWYFVNDFYVYGKNYFNGELWILKNDDMISEKIKNEIYNIGSLWKVFNNYLLK